MGTLEFFGPVVDQLRIDDFVGFRLDQGQCDLVWHLILIAQAHDCRRHHEQMLELLALDFQAAAETCCNKTAEGEAKQRQW
ncbi:hypothetical protein D3C84_1015070 [compost metagenome]